MPDFDFADRVQLYLPEEPLAEIPAHPGIYILFDAKQRVRRMVATRDLRARARYYLHERAEEEPDSLSVARREAAALGWLPTFSRFETRFAHMLLFRHFFPDAFQALYRLPAPHLLRVTTDEPYPRLLPARTVTAEHLHLGPYLHRDMVEAEINFVNELLELRRCDYEIQRFHPYERCLYLQMGTCVAPCDTLPQAEYCALSEQAVELLSGNIAPVRATLVARRDRAAAELEFEAAMRWRDRITALEQWAANRPDFLRPLPDLTLVIPQQTELGLDLFVARQGALVAWLRLQEPSEERVALLLAETLAAPWERPPWGAMRDAFAFLSRWLWDRENNAHVMVNNPARAAAAIMALAARGQGEWAEEGKTEDLPLAGESMASGEE